jgi:hypothetical protein
MVRLFKLFYYYFIIKMKIHLGGLIFKIRQVEVLILYEVEKINFQYYLMLI